MSFTMDSTLYGLGIDIGTTTLKAVLVEHKEHKVIEQYAELTADSVLPNESGRDEQDVIKILTTLNELIEKFSTEKRKKIIGISVTGQMHGVTLWNSTHDDLSKLLTSPQSCSPNCISPLVTWRDGRCSDTFLESLPKASKPVSTGYGCCTLFWLQRFDQFYLERFNQAGTIMDLVVCILCGGLHNNITMSTQNANSWGYFDTINNNWEIEILEAAMFPICLLPKVSMAPCLAGTLNYVWHNIPAGIPIGIAMGDLQCSVYSVQPDLRDAVLNIGTASQLSVIKPTDVSIFIDYKQFPSLTEIPYFDNTSLLVAASLTGGNAFSMVIDMFKEFLQCLNLEIPKDDEIYSTLIEMASIDTTLQFDPAILGERHQPTKRGSITNIAIDNFTVGDVVSSVLRGVVQNLETMMPTHLLETLQVKHLIGCGSALYRNRAMIEHIERVFRLPLTLKCNDAPVGAVLANEKLF